MYTAYVDLSDTGGMGTMSFYLGGIGLIALSGFGLYRKKKRKTAT